MSKKTENATSPHPTPPAAERENIVAPDTAAVLFAQRGVERKAKEAQKALKDLQGSADALAQASLGLAVEFEPELLMTSEERRKKYTGAQAEKMEWRVDACLLMLSREIAVEDIARVLRMNLRTIEALARNHGKKLATFSNDYAEQLIKTAGGWIALANTKASEASTLQLATAAGIIMQHATAIKGTLAGSGNAEIEALPVEDPKVTAAREFLARMKSAKPTENLTAENAENTEEKKP